MRRFLGNLGRNISEGWYKMWLNFRNWRRTRRKISVDYIVMPLAGSFPERDGPRRGFFERRLPLPPPPLSMQGFNRRLQLIADASNVRGVVFLLRNLPAGLATLQNMRQSIERLRAAGKEIVVYTPFLDMRHYYIASVADRIIAPPGAKFDALGLYTEVTFLKDALARAGIGVDVIQISPYKTAFDRLGQDDLTPEHRAQLSWLLDEQYDLLTGAMAQSRGMSQERLQSLIDESPLTLEQALAHGLIDQIAYDDELPALLAPEQVADGTTPAKQTSVKPGEPRRAKLKTWSEARPLLLETYRQPTKRFVGVVSLEGAIAMGSSRRSPIDLPIPFIGDAIIGEQTVVGLLRRLEKQKDLAAVILHVDSGGGSALASDLIGRQVSLLAQKKPVVVYMGNIAASGGYYIAAPAQRIMSQTSTLTGSIGVIMAHVTTAGLLSMLSVNRTSLQRGDNAGLYLNTDPLDEPTRAIYWQEITHTYEQFKRVVAEGRALPIESLDSVCEGRVWTGRQAQQHGLVDNHGDFPDAIQEAAKLGGITFAHVAEVSTVNFFARDSSYTLPPDGQKALLQQLAAFVTGERLREVADQPLLLMPFDFRLR